jgi:hypothetical protein
MRSENFAVAVWWLRVTFGHSVYCCVAFRRVRYRRNGFDTWNRCNDDEFLLRFWSEKFGCLCGGTDTARLHRTVTTETSRSAAVKVGQNFYSRSQNCEKRLSIVTCIREHWTVRLTMDGFSWNLIFVPPPHPFRKSFEKVQVWLKFDKNNNGYFTWRLVCTFMIIKSKRICILFYAYSLYFIYVWHVQGGREVTVHRPIFPNPAVSLFVVETY